MEEGAPKLGSGEWMTAVGTGLGQRVAAVPTASATGSKTSIATQGGRDTTRQVAGLSLLVRQGSPQRQSKNARQCLLVLSRDCHDFL